METIEIKINGEYLSNLRFADNVVIITEKVNEFKIIIQIELIEKSKQKQQIQA